MATDHPTPANSARSPAPLDLEAQSATTFAALGQLVGRLTSWLFEVGSWIFGGLMAFGLIIISALLTVGPVDAAVLTSTTALAIALPLNIAGIFVLRLVKDINDAGLDDLVLKSFADAGFPNIDAYFPPAEVRTTLRQRRATVVLTWSVAILAISVALSVTGLVAALWHMRWWIGAGLLAMAVLTSAVVVAVVAYAMPPETGGEKELKRRYAAFRRQRGRA